MAQASRRRKQYKKERETLLHSNLSAMPYIMDVIDNKTSFKRIIDSVANFYVTADVLQLETLPEVSELLKFKAGNY